MKCPTVKVKPWGKDQGDFVEVNAEDYDPKVHNLAEGEVAPEPVAETEAEDVGPMPANPDDLVVPPLEQVANYAPAPKAPAKTPEPAPVHRQRKKLKLKARK